MAIWVVLCNSSSGQASPFGDTYNEDGSLAQKCDCCKPDGYVCPCNCSSSSMSGSSSSHSSTSGMVGGSSLSGSSQSSRDTTLCDPLRGCCPGETGDDCGHFTDGAMEACCCCPSDQAPVGPDCECVFVGGGGG